MKQQKIFENSKFDFFIIWNNGRKFESQILKIINENFDIIRIKRYKSFLFYFDLIKLYRNSFVPIYFLLKKLFYLRKYNNEFLAVEIINKKPSIEHNFNGVFRSYYCKKLLNVKDTIRSRFQTKNSEEHIVHTTDTIHDYIAVKKVIGNNTKPYFGKYKNTLNIEVKSLYCTQSYGSRYNFKDKIVPLEESEQFNYLLNKNNNYEKYINKFIGTSIQFYHSTEKFDELFSKLKFNQKLKENIILKKRLGKYIILDGLHRASIFLYLGKRFISGDLYE